MPGVLLARVCRWGWLNPENGEVEVWTGWVNPGDIWCFNLLPAGICRNASGCLRSLPCLGRAGISGLIGICWNFALWRQCHKRPCHFSIWYIREFADVQGATMRQKTKRNAAPFTVFFFFSVEELDIALTQIKVQFRSYFMCNFPNPCETPSSPSPYTPFCFCLSLSSSLPSDTTVLSSGLEWAHH